MQNAQGLKPIQIPFVLRGPEGPLFHSSYGAHDFFDSR